MNDQIMEIAQSVANSLGIPTLVDYSKNYPIEDPLGSSICNYVQFHRTALLLPNFQERVEHLFKLGLLEAEEQNEKVLCWNLLDVTRIPSRERYEFGIELTVGESIEPQMHYLT